MKQDHQGGNMQRSWYRNDVDWRDLCEQASREQDSDKLIEIVQRLNAALEDRRRTKDPTPAEFPNSCDDSRPPFGLSY